MIDKVSKHELHIHSVRRSQSKNLFLLLALLSVLFSSINLNSESNGTKAYVGLFKDNSVGVVDTAQYSLIKTIPVPPGPHGLVITNDNSRVYVSSDGDSVVSVIDTAKDVVRNTIIVGKSPHGLAITPDGSIILAAIFGENKIVFIDTSTDKVTGGVNVASPHNIAISPDGKIAYVASQPKDHPAIVIIDIAKKTLSGSIPVTNIPRAIAVSPDGKSISFTMAGIDAISVLDAASKKIIAKIPVGASPHHPVFTKDGKYLLVVSQGTNELNFIDRSKNALVTTVKTGKQPHWIALSADSSTAFVTNESSNDVSVIDLGALKAISTIKVGNGPRKIVVQKATAKLLDDPVPVSIEKFSFPDTVTITAGQSIVWQNNDSVSHSVQSTDGSWDSGEITSGKSFTFRFDKPGTYQYTCGYHAFMTGTIVVKGLS
jgi:YVTN family beta-propeller protein